MTDLNASRFDVALAKFLEGAQAKVDAAYTDDQAKLSPMHGKRYVRVVVTLYGSQRSAYCFVDKKTGDVLKCASWKGPAKHARSNIFNEHHGVDGVGPYGAAYLK